MERVNATYRQLLSNNQNNISKCIEFVDNSLSFVPIENIKEIDFWLDVRLELMSRR